MNKEFRNSIKLPQEKKISRAALSILLCAFFLFVGQGTAQGEGNIHISKLRIHPFVSVSQTSSDNIYSTSTVTAQPVSDSIITFTPGVKLQLPFGKHQAEAGYYAVINRYKDQPGEDTDNAYANGTIDLSAGNPVGLRLSDAYVKGHEPRGSSATGFIEKFKSNTAILTAAYQLANRSKIQADYGKSWWDYQTSTFRNRDETLSSGYFFYRFLPKTSAFVQVTANRVTYDDPVLDLDSTATSGLAGISWEITEMSKGMIKAGVQRKDFDAQPHRTFTGSVGAIDLHHQFSDFTAFTLMGQRAVNETSLVGSRYILTTGASAVFTHRFGRRVEAAVRGLYGIDEFSDPIIVGTEARKDGIGMGGAGIKFFFRDLLELGFDYAERRRHSNFSVNNYEERTYMVSVSMVL